MGHRVRRWLYLVHRWIGIASCLLFAMWFLSGLVMIYVPYPSLKPEERIAHLRPIEWSSVTTAPPVVHDARSIALEMRGGHPLWRINPWEGKDRLLSAEDGERLEWVDAALARRVAREFQSSLVVSVEGLARDQWTVAQRFDAHRPLWKIRYADRVRTEIYVSSATGEVLQETTAAVRFWNWLGSVPHWIYPTILRQDGAAWRQVVLWVSGPCLAAAITGMWIGILRARLGRRRFRGGRVTPYHGWMLWHHVAGLVGGLFLVTWIFSGWLSVDPGQLFRSEGISLEAERRYMGSLRQSPAANWPLTAEGASRVEIVPAPADRALLLIDRPGKPRQVLDADTLGPATLPRSELARTGSRLMPDARIAKTEWLTRPDSYWYELGSAPKLPVLRLQFDDEAETWVHIDPRTGKLLGSIDARGRTYRWLYDLLHKWDLHALTSRRPLWDVLLWCMTLLGLVTSVSGIVIAWRRLWKARARP